MRGAASSDVCGEWPSLRGGTATHVSGGKNASGCLEAHGLRAVTPSSGVNHLGRTLAGRPWAPGNPRRHRRQ